MKKIAIAASAVCLVALGAFAKEKLFAPSAIGYYKNTANQCIALTAGSSQLPFDAAALGDPVAQISGTNGTVQLYSNSGCTTNAKFTN